MIDGAGLWRRAVMKPSDAGGDVLLGLANALLGEFALPELTSHATTPKSLAANYAAVPEEVRSGLRVASEREQARQRSEIETLVSQRESENRPEDAAAMRARLRELSPPSARLVLLIDQLEELFTDGISVKKRDLFLEVIAALSRRNPVVVVVTIRSDFFPRLAEFPLLRALAQGTASYHLAPPAPVELGQIIRRPAQAAGLKFDTHPDTKQGLDEALRDAAAADPLARRVKRGLGQFSKFARSGESVFSAYGLIAGEVRIAWTDHLGSRQTKRVKFQFRKCFCLFWPEQGGVGPSSGKYDVLLETEGKDYVVPFAYKRTVAAGGNDRFTLQVASQISTYQNFRIRLTTADGREIISQRCRMHFLVPRRFSWKEGRVIEQQ